MYIYIYMYACIRITQTLIHSQIDANQTTHFTYIRIPVGWSDASLAWCFFST